MTHITYNLTQNRTKNFMCNVVKTKTKLKSKKMFFSFIRLNTMGIMNAIECNKPYRKEDFPKDSYNFCNTCATNRQPFYYSPNKYVAPIDRAPTHKTCFGCLKTVRYTRGSFCDDCNSKSVEELLHIRSKALAKQKSAKASPKAVSPKAASSKAASPKASPRNLGK